uniref:Bac_surface_Ag domain-containing protein n=1 Tax=Steinernema glaseri TaxID=37863 RepID=A0A1I7YAA7_9BILA
MTTRPTKAYHRAEMIYDLSQDTPATVESVQFHGIHKTKFDAIVREVAELYRSGTLGELIEKSSIAAKHMQEVGLFTQATPLIDIVPGKKNSYVINYVVKEPRNMTLGVKVGVTTHGEADVSFNAGKQSFNGRAESISSSYSRANGGSQSFNFSLAKPRLGWQKYASFSGTLSRTFSGLPWSTADITENAFVLGYRGQMWKKRLQHSINVNTIWRLLHAQNAAPFAVREHAGHTMKCSIENVLGIDTRDRPILASKGYLLRGALEYAGLMGDAAFIRHQVDVQAAAPLFLGAFLSASLQATYVSPVAERVLHLADRTYIGGPQDVRGFALNSIGTRAGPASLGGAASAVAAAHIYRPLYPADMVFAHGFVTAGTTASVRSQNLLKDMMEVPRVSAGVGFAFLFKNFIRLELNYVLPLRYVPGDSISPGFQMGVGMNFL